MSSDSDNTDVLLTIPPNYFFLNNSCQEFCGMSGSYHHLPPRHQLELENIDSRLSQVELSTIPNSKYDHLEILPINEDNLYHSTPRYSSSLKKDLITKTNTEDVYKFNEFHTNDNVINEIDKFLNSSKQHQILCNKSITPSQSCDVPQKYNANFENSKLTSEKFQIEEHENNLISLSELWNTTNGSGGVGGGGGHGNDNYSLQEEKLRRQHCEKVIKVLQNKLLEYQQKISVAIQVDKNKDNVLEKLQIENHRLRVLTNELDDKLTNFEKQKNELSEKLRAENEEFKNQKDTLEKELSQALNLVSKFQDKNEVLELKVENLTKASTDIGSVYKKQIEDLETRLLNYQKNEKILNDELNKLKSHQENLKINFEKSNEENNNFKKQLENQNIQLEQLKNDKNNWNIKLNNAKKKIDELEIKNKQLEEYNVEISEKEKRFLKEFENQRISLKSYYQQQLENVVTQKLKEFQSQLDCVETQLRLESKERERLIAERAIKQVEMVNEKNEQEIMLLNEKHHEEVELYRIQLANSAKKINDLEEILEDYRTRRADVAKKLHNVMETQWKKALEILTSPSGNNSDDESSSHHDIFSKIISRNVQDQEKLDGVQKYNNKAIKTRPENEYFETPKSSIRYHGIADANTVDNHKNIDRLQAYIEMLLNKSPSDLDNLQEILAMPKTSTTKLNKSEKSKNESSKPPWK